MHQIGVRLTVPVSLVWSVCSMY